MSQIGVQSLTTPTQEHGPSRSDNEAMEIEDQEDTGQDVGQDIEVITQPPRESINGLESVQTTASQPEIPISTLHAILPSFTSTLFDVAAQQSPDEFRDGTNFKAAKRQQPLKSPEESLLKSPVREDDVSKLLKFYSFYLSKPLQWRAFLYNVILINKFNLARSPNALLIEIRLHISNQ